MITYAEQSIDRIQSKVYINSTQIPILIHCISIWDINTSLYSHIHIIPQYIIPYLMHIVEKIITVVGELNE